MKVQQLWLPKGGNAIEEYEDAAGHDLNRQCFAIADGATESSFAGEWARLMVRDFVEAPVANPIQKWPARLQHLRHRWSRLVRSSAMPWYAEAKLEAGAAATFLGLVIRKRSSLPVRSLAAGVQRRYWQALAVGDSCLFQIRGGQLVAKFPVQRAADFGSTPSLVVSRRAANPSVTRICQKRVGSWRAGDRFWLMTDALAQWFLQEEEIGARPLTQIDALLRQCDADATGAFACWVNRQRDCRTMRNDDVTLIALTL